MIEIEFIETLRLAKFGVSKPQYTWLIQLTLCFKEFLERTASKLLHLLSVPEFQTRQLTEA